jgi:hypothetical protein
METCPCCESKIEAGNELYVCGSCAWTGCYACQAFHLEISGHSGNDASSDTETSTDFFSGISRGIC